MSDAWTRVTATRHWWPLGSFGVQAQKIANRGRGPAVSGAAAAIGAGRFVNALLFNLAANDATMIVVTAVTLALAAAVAGYLPARRAARIDPMTALRDE